MFHEGYAIVSDVNKDSIVYLLVSFPFPAASIGLAVKRKQLISTNFYDKKVVRRGIMSGRIKRCLMQLVVKTWAQGQYDI